jgi:hypothetical protein
MFQDQGEEAGSPRHYMRGKLLVDFQPVPAEKGPVRDVLLIRAAGGFEVKGMHLLSSGAEPGSSCLGG